MDTIDLSFQPDTYWPESLTPEQLLSRIRGSRRQKIARDIFEQVGFSGLTAFLVKEGLADEERDAWGAVGPWCLGGEYLPELLPGEVEIVRISMASTTSDQVSVRARRDGALIRYHIVGEYEEQELMRYILPFETSEEPLSLARVMELIAGAYIPDCAYPGGIFNSIWEMMRDSGCAYAKEEIVGFLALSSPFYPQVEERYLQMAGEWLESWATYDDDEEE